jgi:hypothetical protein
MEPLDKRKILITSKQVEHIKQEVQLLRSMDHVSGDPSVRVLHALILFTAKHCTDI